MLWRPCVAAPPGDYKLVTTMLNWATCVLYLCSTCAGLGLWTPRVLFFMPCVSIMSDCPLHNLSSKAESACFELLSLLKRPAQSHLYYHQAQGSTRLIVKSVTTVTVCTYASVGLTSHHFSSLQSRTTVQRSSSMPGAALLLVSRT